MNYSRRITVIGTASQMAEAQSFVLETFFDLGYAEPKVEIGYEMKDEAFTVLAKSDSVSQDSIVEFTFKKYIKLYTKSRQGSLTHKNYDTSKKKNEKNRKEA